MTPNDLTTVVHAPRPRTASRRTQLAEAAAARIHAVGYHRVSLADVAEDVGVTGPAVYRHFRNKQALLEAAIASGLDVVEAALARAEGGPLDELMFEGADAALERPDLWVLLQREARFLDAEARDRIQEQFAGITHVLLRTVRRERPGSPPDVARLLVAAATAVLSTPSFSRATLPREAYRRELTDAALAALRVHLPAGPAEAGPAPDAPVAEPPRSRRVEILDTAIELFFRRGYTAVTLDEIGAAVGMAGPSLYHHFETKADILVAAFDRAATHLRADRQRLTEHTATPALGAQVSSYVRFCLHNRALVGVYVSEVTNLPPRARAEITALIRQGVADWTRALLRVDGRLDERVALVRVRAALAAIHDLVRLGHLYTRPRIAAEIGAIARAVLLRGADAR